MKNLVRKKIPDTVFSGFRLYVVLLICYPFFLLNEARADTTSSDTSLRLSTRFDQLSVLTKAIVARELINSKEEFRRHQVVLKQGRIFIAIRKELENARNFLKQGYSYREIKQEIDRLNDWREIAGEGVITDKDPFGSVRNLTTTSILLKELLNRTNDRLKLINSYHTKLGQFQYRLDSLLMDSVLYVVPGDSVSLMHYFDKLLLLNKDYQPVNIPLKNALDSIEKLEITVSRIKYNLESDIAETELQRKALFERLGLIETETPGHMAAGDVSTEKVVLFSLKKAGLVLRFYVINHISTLITMLLLILGLAYYLTLLARHPDSGFTEGTITQENPGMPFPVASAFLSGLTVFQFILPLPPIAFTGIIWLICGVALTVIMRKSVSHIEYNAWLVFFGLFMVGYFGQLLLWPTVIERMIMLFYAIAALASALFFLTAFWKFGIGNRLIMVFMGIMVFCEVLALVNYMTGGYNQAKTLIATGVIGVIVAYFLFKTTHILFLLVQLSVHFFKPSEYNNNATDPHLFSNRLSSFFFYFLFLTGWFILISRNFYYYQSIFEPFFDTLAAERTIGAFTFTFKGVFIFLGILLLSGFISRIVSFLSSDRTAGAGNSTAGGLGSWMLLIRIAIITVGVLLAFVSAGIPMDRFAIILGALSVGIGFGLQTLINNLVSGVIIAFEKPINVGDIVEITGQIGKMKSIGIRSSVVTTWDGADVIIPNGDLLNQHLINWTLGNSQRRFELLLGVAYGTDLYKVQQLLLDIMEKDVRILKTPKPIVLANEFNNSSVDLVLKFWVPHFSIGFDVKSDLIVAIDRLFKEHGIEIPFPQQDVYLKSERGNPARIPEEPA